MSTQYVAKPWHLRSWMMVGLSALILHVAASGVALAADCPAATVADPKGIKGAYPQQYELAEFEAQGKCKLSFKQNPAIADLNARIVGNPKTLPPVAERLPVEPLVVAPYDKIGQYGGQLDGLSNATEAGTSDILSLRHVNFVRYSDDLQTIVPNVAKSWQWNEDFTELTFVLRQGHRWSDGQPFTTADVDFWFNDLIMNSEIFEKTPSLWVFEGKPIKVEAVDETTVKFVLPTSVPGLLNRFAISYIQPFQPKHILSQYHLKYNPKANELAAERGKNNWAELLNAYYGGSDWKDVPSPLLKGDDTRVLPTLESHILVEESTKGRHLVANPYFHMVDTAGNQLPYINTIDERYVPEKEVRNLKVVNGEVDYKIQNLFLADFPLYKENESKGNYTVHLSKALGENVYYAFNTTDKDPVLRQVFNDVRFRQAMSLAINRDEVNELVYLDQGAPIQATPAHPDTVAFITDEHKTAYTQYDVAKAKALLDEMGLKDSDGDGVRERPDGKPFIMQVLFANQGGPTKMHELVQGYWSDVGIRINLREVSTDEYRASGQANDLSVTSWRDGNRTAPTVSQITFMFRSPFGDEWQPGTGFEWATWLETGGKEGTEPPADAKRVWELAEKFVLAPLGSEESNKIGREVADIHLKNLWKIGVVGDVVSPVLVTNTMGNFKPFTVKTYDYYWAYPFRPQQWYFTQTP